MAANEKSAVNLCGKYVLFFATFLLFLITGAAAGVSAYAITLREVPIESLFEYISDWPCVICTLASYMCLMSFVGWLGALREYPLSILIFKIMLGVLVLLELTAVIMIFLLVYEASVQNLIYDEDTYRQALKEYRNPQFESLQELVDTAQKDWDCCGVSNDEEGYKDWSVNEYFNCSRGTTEQYDFCSVPHTCCKTNDGDIVNVLCGQGMADPDLDESIRTSTINTKGCFLALRERLNKNILWIGIVALAIIVPELFLYKLAMDLRHGVQTQLIKQDRIQQNFDRIASNGR